MNKSNEVLSRVKQALGIEVALEQRKLENGTVIEAEKFQAEEPVFIVTEDEKVALPVGEYEMEDGMTLAVAEEGIISDIVEKVAEKVADEQTEEVEAEAESREPKKVVESTVKESHFAEEQKEEEEVEAGYVTKEELGQAVEEIKAMIDEVKAEYVKSEEEKEKKEEEVAELKEELSQAAVKPLRHNPEGADQKREQVRFASNSKNTVLNRILTKINQ